MARKILLTTVSWYTEWQMSLILMYQFIGSSNNDGPTAAVVGYLSEPEQAMGRWVMGQWVKWVTFGDGSHASWVGAY